MHNLIKCRFKAGKSVPISKDKSGSNQILQSMTWKKKLHKLWSFEGTTDSIIVPSMVYIVAIHRILRMTR